MSGSPPWLDGLMAALLIAGAVFALVGSFALVRLPDFFLRLHGPSKAGTLGVGCTLLASSLWFAVNGQPSLGEVWVVLFLFITAPVSAHLLARAAMHSPHEAPAGDKESEHPPH